MKLTAAALLAPLVLAACQDRTAAENATLLGDTNALAALEDSADNLEAVADNATNALAAETLGNATAFDATAAANATDAATNAN